MPCLNRGRGLKEVPIWGAAHFPLQRIFVDGGVVITSLLKMFDEKGPAKPPSK